MRPFLTRQTAAGILGQRAHKRKTPAAVRACEVRLSRSPEPGARSPEPGARSPEPGARSPEPGAPPRTQVPKGGRMSPFRECLLVLRSRAPKAADPTLLPLGPSCSRNTP
ncbi:hypothetical protein SCWH03_20560 [Streptomyces pacificus]|uniref:Uncharacterized protein n=1 Tax=Streptomyces pacificus TaxID=2705029 RepID=A0A6A0AV76_9ACTN|nr:hypothetical protein SCWH03_20560 [Streptomyces pacificus]